MGWGSHILAKRGPKRWPPETFGNSCDCTCMTDSVPAQSYYYYSRQRRSGPCCDGLSLPETLHVTTSSACACVNGITFPIRLEAGPCLWSTRGVGVNPQVGCTPFAPDYVRIGNPVGCDLYLLFQFNPSSTGSPTNIVIVGFNGFLLCSSAVHGFISTTKVCTPLLYTASASFTFGGAPLNPTCTCCGAGATTITLTVTE
jgi:hypothetical protein